jgi:hypothetical protein
MCSDCNGDIRNKLPGCERDIGDFFAGSGRVGGRGMTNRGLRPVFPATGAESIVDRARDERRESPAKSPLG